MRNSNYRSVFFYYWQVGLLILCLVLPSISVAQDTTGVFSKKRFRTLTVTGTALYAAMVVGLNEAWYKNHERTGFHFFNDNREWQQIDKAGHFYSTYHISRLGNQAFRWTGLSRKKSVWLGSLTGLVCMMPIEIMDGFSSAYGASWGDLVANTAGAAFNLQHLVWEQPRIHPKFSFHRTAFAALRPNTLGGTLSQQILKDYNGQTYWLSFDIQPWLSRESRFPAWLAVAVGYGASNMLYSDATANRIQGYDTYRQYYLALDVNLTQIPVTNRTIRRLFFLINTIRIPAPALEYNRQQGWIFHPIYF